MVKAPPVQYEKQALVIRITTGSPAVTHEQLMKGIIEAMRLHITSADRTTDATGLLSLLQLHQTLVPPEDKLTAAYDY